MKPQENRLFGQGVRDLCAGARSWCGKLEAVSSTTRRDGLPAAIARSFASVLDGAEPRLDLRGLTLWLIHTIRRLIVRLLAEETFHRETLAALPPARSRRDAAFQELFRQLTVFRQLGLSDSAGPVIPPGRLPRRPDELAALAATVRPHLDSPDLKLPPGVRMLPTLRPGFDQATAAVAAAMAAVEEAQERSRKTCATRDATSGDLSAHVTAARSLHRALCDLRALDRGADGAAAL